MQYNIGVVSLGCSKNLVDTEIMLGLLQQGGYAIVNKPEDAHVLIVNTCGFIDSAKQESIDNILQMAEYKETGKCKILIVTGCLAERYRDDVIKEIPEVDAVIGTGNYTEIAEVIQEAFGGKKVIRYGNMDNSNDEGLPRLQSTPSYTAFLKVADGCDNLCTYCIIPKLRGKYRSRTIESIVREAAQMSERGVKELIIIAQDTTRYGIDLYGSHKLDDLLEELCKIEKIEWIRLHYCYPEEITENLVNTIANNSKICHYIDMPIQHASNKILKRMGRRGTREQVLALIKNIKEKMPDVALRTSIIVGFPGEDEDDFGQLVSFIKEVKFDRLGVFKYSQEEDTPAALFKDQIADETKEDRYNRLMTIQNEISMEQNMKKVGKVFKVLVEGYDKDIYLYYGRTYADSVDIDGKVLFSSIVQFEPGDLVSVKINQVSNYDLIGESLDESGK